MSDSVIFVGNRRFVLEQMLRENIRPSAVFVFHGTHLQRDLDKGLIPEVNNAVVFKNKAELLTLLKQTKFDVLVSNGCPFILPIAELPKAKYVNIHPSYLPDLRGADPAIGALLFKRDAGATCHLMDAGIDTGPIVSQLRIPYTDDLDVTTLYQLSFVAEKRVFSEALAQNFEPTKGQLPNSGLVYYSRKKEDRIITFEEPNDFILQKIKAFNNRAAGCEFIVRGISFRVFSARTMSNPFLSLIVKDFAPLTVALSYENSIVFHKDGQVLKFDGIESSDGSIICVGELLH